MTFYLVKWAAVSLLMPLLVMLFGQTLNNTLILIFWPGSIALISLGADKKPLSEVVYVWIIAVGLNALLYLFIGLVLHFFLKMIKG